jgi:hypothetical protein
MGSQVETIAWQGWMKRGWIGIVFQRIFDYDFFLNAIAICNFAADVFA